LIGGVKIKLSLPGKLAIASVPLLGSGATRLSLPSILQSRTNLTAIIKDRAANHIVLTKGV
jgi:hypothetical protein